MTVGFNAIFPKITSINFTVKNIAPTRKSIQIFNYKIDWNKSVDLLNIDGVSEADIRQSLIKGEIAFKIRTGELEVVSSSIDLVQFDAEQKAFLESAGITDGIEPGASGSSGTSLTESEQAAVDGAVPQLKSTSFATTSARNAWYTLDTSSVAITATISATSRVIGDTVRFTDISGNAATRNVTLTQSGGGTTLDTDTSMILNTNGFDVVLRWNGTYWEVLNHPRASDLSALVGGLHGSTPGTSLISPYQIDWNPGKLGSVVESNYHNFGIVTSNATPVLCASSQTIAVNMRTDVIIIARASSLSSHVTFEKAALFKRDGGTLSLVGTVVDKGTVPTPYGGAWDLTIALGADNTWEAHVVGEAATEIFWNVTVRTFLDPIPFFIE